MSKFTFGTDPEFMLRDKSGKYLSAIGVIPGTKSKRHMIGKNAYYYDNVLAECTVAPAKSKIEAVANIGLALKRFAKLIEPCELVPQASQEYPKDQLLDKRALEIGCKRETCAYALIQPEPPEDLFVKSQLRSAGGHVHIGAKVAQDDYGCLAMVRMFDLFLGIPSIFLDHDKTSLERKKLYGQPGRFRKPKHGVEYRSVGNFWLKSPKLVALTYDISEFILKFVESKKHEKLWQIDFARLSDENAWNDPAFEPSQCHKCIGYDSVALRTAIATMDKDKGEEFMKLISTLMPAKLYERICKQADASKEYSFYDEWNLR